METASITLRCMHEHANTSVEVVRISPDCRWVAVGRSTGVLEIFSTLSRHLRLRLSDYSCSSIRNILWFPLSSAAVEASKVASEGYVVPFPEVSLFEWRVVTAGLHGVVTSWNLRTCRTQAECASTGGAIFCLCPSPRDSLLPLFAAACDDGRVRIYKLTGPADEATRAAVDDPYAGLFPADHEEEELKLISTLPKTKTRLLSVCWYSPNLLFAGNSDSCILRFCRNGTHSPFVADGKMALEAQRGAKGNSEHTSALVWNLRALPRHSLLVSGDSRGCVTLWSLPTCVALRSLQVHVADVLDLDVMTSTESFIDTENSERDTVVKLRQEVILSVGLDGKLSAISRTEDDRWVVRACRYPHPSDARALGCVVKVPDDGGSSMVITGAADGSLKFLQQVTELAGLKAPCREFSSSPLLEGLLAPRLLWRDGNVVCPSESEIAVWHVDKDILSGGKLGTASNELKPPLIRLAKILPKKGSKFQCCDVSADGKLIAAGGQEGLQIFAFDSKELRVRSVSCQEEMSIKGAVCSIAFVSKYTIACCSFSNQKPKGHRSLTKKQISEFCFEISGVDGACSSSTESHRSKKRRHSASMKPTAATQATFGGGPLVDISDGFFRLAFIDVLAGNVVALIDNLPFPVVLMRLNPNHKLLGCLNTNGSVFVVNAESHHVTHVFPNAFRRGETVANFCFSYDGSKIMILGTRNGYYIASLDEEGGRQHSDYLSGFDEKDRPDVKRTKGVSSRKALSYKKSIRTIPQRLLPSGDACILDCQWIVNEPGSEGRSVLLCLTPSCLYRIPLATEKSRSDSSGPSFVVTSVEGHINRISSLERHNSCLLSENHLSSPHQTSSGHSLLIGPSPAHGAAFIAPRILPLSLVKRAEGISVRSSNFGCLSSESTGTQSTVSSPAGSPTKADRNESGETTHEDEKIALSEHTTDISEMDSVLNTSKHKGFLGFSFHKSSTSKMKGANCKQTLVLFEAMENHEGESNVGALPHFSRKRYGT